MCVLNEVKGIKLSMQNKIRKAEETDKNQILALYHSLIGTEGCTWSLEYPYQSRFRKRWTIHFI